MAQCKWCGADSVLSFLTFSAAGLCSKCNGPVAKDIQSRIKITKESTIIVSTSKNTATRLRRIDLALSHIGELKKYHEKGIVDLTGALEKTVPYLESTKTKLLKELEGKPKRHKEDTQGVAIGTDEAKLGEAFEKTRWGMSQRTVKQIYPPENEDSVMVEIIEDGGPTTTGFESEIEFLGLDAFVDFGFSDDKLDEVSVELHISPEDFFNSYLAIKQHLTGKFGSPSGDKEKWNGQPQENGDWGELLANGKLEINASWRTKVSQIYFTCGNGDIQESCAIKITYSKSASI